MIPKYDSNKAYFKYREKMSRFDPYPTSPLIMGRCRRGFFVVPGLTRDPGPLLSHFKAINNLDPRSSLG